MGIKLNIGAGSSVIPGFTPYDIKTGDDALILHHADDSVDEIRASHVLEHFSYGEAKKALLEWFRALKPGGRIRIAVPDLSRLDYSDRDCLWRFQAFGGQVDGDDYHKSGWIEATLRGEMALAGFEAIKPWESDGRDTSADPISLNLEGMKPMEQAEATTQDVKIAAAMSVPRLGFNDFWGGACDALRPWGIPIHRYTGAFWGQCLQNCFEDLIDQGVDWILTLDYDTLFTSEQFDTLLGHFGQNPHIDALAALQPKRSEGTPLMSIKGESGVDVTGAPIKVDSAHFGLTLLRADAISALPKPWFHGMPGPDGSWRHKDRLDEDIWFWHQWRQHKKTLYVAPDVRVGHLEIMVSEFDADMQQHHISVKDWFARKAAR